MKCYRLQPQAQSHVYRSVLLSSRRRPNSANSDSGRPSSGSNSPTDRAERLANIRSSSALPVPAPDSQPPTPTRLSGNTPSLELERSDDRGDLIKFYNTVFVTKVKEFAMKFSKSKKANVSAQILYVYTVCNDKTL